MRVSITGDRGNVRALFRIPGFRRLLGVRLSSQFSDGLFQAALAGSVLFNPAQQTSPIKIATGFALLIVPFSVIGPYVGVFLDRWSRRDIVHLANLIRAVIALPGAVLLWTEGAGPRFFGCVLLITAINRFFLAGLSAAQPHVVPEPLLVTGNATATTLGTFAYSLGLGATALSLRTFLNTDNHGYAWCAVAASLGYLGSSLFARISFERQTLGPDSAEDRTGSLRTELGEVARGMLAGARHLAERRPVAYAMLAQSLCRTMYGVLTLATLLLYSRYFFHTYTAALGGLGQIVVIGSFGAIAAAFVTPYATRRIGGHRWIVALTALIAIALPVLALPYLPPLLVVATFVLNLASQGTKIVVDTNVQLRCDENFRGRVFSVNDTVFNISWIIGLFAAALVLPDNGRSTPTIIGVSIGYLLIAAWYAFATRGVEPAEASRVSAEAT